MFTDKIRIEYYEYRIIAMVDLSCLCRSKINRRYQILSDPRDKREISEFSADKENPRYHGRGACGQRLMLPGSQLFRALLVIRETGSIFGTEV